MPEPKVMDPLSHKVAARFLTAGDSWDAWYDHISMNASNKLRALDESFVGTPDYMGIAYFWGQDYKHSLRAASPLKRKAVHDAFLHAHLPLDGASPQHEGIVKKLVGL